MRNADLDHFTSKPFNQAIGDKKLNEHIPDDYCRVVHVN